MIDAVRNVADLADGAEFSVEIDPNEVDAARLDAQVLQLAQRIDCVHDERSRYPDAFSGGVKIRLRDGTELEHFELVNRGSEGRALSLDEVRCKFLDNCALTISSESAEQLWDALLHLDQMNDVTALTELLRTGASGAD